MPYTHVRERSFASIRTRRVSRSIWIPFERLEGRELLAADLTLGSTAVSMAAITEPTSPLVRDIRTLVDNLEAIHAASGVTSSEVSAVTADFKAIVAVATRPSTTSVQALESELHVIAGQSTPVSTVEVLVLEKDVNAVLTSAQIPTSLAEQTVADLKSVVVSSAVTKADVEMILGDVYAIALDLDRPKS